MDTFEIFVLWVVKTVVGSVLFFTGIVVTWKALCYGAELCIRPAFNLYCAWRSEMEIFHVKPILPEAKPLNAEERSSINEFFSSHFKEKENPRAYSNK